MKITADMPGAAFITVVRSGNVLGFCREVDLDTKVAKQIIYETGAPYKALPGGAIEPTVLGPFDEDGNFIVCYRYLTFDEIYYDPDRTPKELVEQLPSWVRPHPSGSGVPKPLLTWAIAFGEVKAPDKVSAHPGFPPGYDPQEMKASDQRIADKLEREAQS